MGYRRLISPAAERCFTTLSSSRAVWLGGWCARHVTTIRRMRHQSENGSHSPGSPNTYCSTTDSPCDGSVTFPAVSADWADGPVVRLVTARTSPSIRLTSDSRDERCRDAAWAALPFRSSTCHVTARVCFDGQLTDVARRPLDATVVLVGASRRVVWCRGHFTDRDALIERTREDADEAWRQTWSRTRGSTRREHYLENGYAPSEEVRRHPTRCVYRISSGERRPSGNTVREGFSEREKGYRYDR